MTSKTAEGEYLVSRLLDYKGTEKTLYIEKFTIDWVIHTIQEKDQILAIEKSFEQYEQKGADLLEFTKIFLNVIEHKEDETLYLTISIVDLFKDICETYCLSNLVCSKDIVNYLIEKIMSHNLKTHAIPTKKIPETRKFNKDHRVRDIDINPPTIYGNFSGGIRRLKGTKITSDSNHHTAPLSRVYFAQKTKKIFTMEPLQDHIAVYNIDCELERKIFRKDTIDNDKVMVLDFAWSEKQQRIGLSLKDFSMSFWDASDNFEYEKNFSLTSFVADHQLRMWCIDFLDMWISTDKTHTIYFWDIQNENKIAEISSPKIKNSILDIISLDVLKLVAISSLDKMVTIWDFTRRVMIIELDLDQGGVHTIKWSSNYHILITVGFENVIKLWGINPTYRDISMKGQLVGHSRMVTAVQTIEKSPMIVSADDQGIIRVWDIRNLNCVQVIPLTIKSSINSLLDTSAYGKMCFVGIRINFIDFEEVTTQPISKGEEHAWPLSADYNFSANEIVICTRKDIRFIDVETGRTKKIYAGLLKSEEDEMSTLRLTQQNKRFILGSEKGEVNLYSYATGERIKSFESHGNEVVSVKVDYVNNLTVSCSRDSTLMVVKETPNGCELKKSIKNLHGKKEITLMELSVHHNLIITAAHNNVLYVWDYEYAKLLASLELEEDLEPTFIHIINGRSCLIVGDTSGKVSFIYFKRKDLDIASIEKVGIIDLSSNWKATESCNYKPALIFANKIAVDAQTVGNSETLEACHLYLSTNGGDILCYNILSFFTSTLSSLIPHANKKSNYNAERINHEDFFAAVKNYRIPSFDIRHTYNSDENEKSTCTLLNSYLHKEIKAHHDSLTTLEVLDGQRKRLLTSSLDHYVKVWTIEGTLLASLNVNHPLPMYWSLSSSNASSYQKKVLYAFKVIDAIVKKYKRNLLMSEMKKIAINDFMRELNKGDVQGKLKQDSFKESQGDKSPLYKPNSKHRVMADAYSPRDLQYDKAAQIYQKELQGPSLRQMEAYKRSNIAATTWEKFGLTNEEGEKFEKEPTGSTDKERNEFMQFLLGDGRDNLMRSNFQYDRVRALSNQLDRIAPPPIIQITRDSSKFSANFNPRTSTTFLTSIPRKSNFLSPTRVSSESSAGPLGLNKSPKGLLEKLGDANMTRKETLKLRRRAPASLDERAMKSGGILSRKVSIAKSPDEPTEPTSKPDFFSYAQERLRLPNDTINTSKHAEKSFFGGKLTEFGRKLQSRQFGHIITKLEQKLKKSQTSNFLAKKRNPSDVTMESTLGSVQGSQVINSLKSIVEDADMARTNETVNSRIRKNLSRSTIKLPKKKIVQKEERKSPTKFESLLDMKKSIEDVLGLRMDGQPGDKDSSDSRSSFHIGFNPKMLKKLNTRDRLGSDQNLKTKGFESLDKLFELENQRMKSFGKLS